MAWKHLPVPTVRDSGSELEVVQREGRNSVTSSSVACCVTLGESLHLSGPLFPSRDAVRVEGLG